MASLKYTIDEIPNLPSNEIMLQKVREFIKTFQEQLIKNWCISPGVRQLGLGPQGEVRKKQN